MPTLLVVDDEPNVLYSLEQALATDDLHVITAPTARQGIDRVRRDSPDAVVLDVRLPDMSGLDAFERIRQIDARLPVVIITAFAATQTAIEAMKRGAFEYLLKPVDLRQLRRVVGQALELSRLQRVPVTLDGSPAPDGADESERIVGRSQAMQDVYKAIGRVASTDATVLILGESGTGKELVAHAIHQHSSRAKQPYLAINCAAIPESLLESELFGHEKGAFTGADRQRIGKFEQCHGGTLFLDEVGDMPPTLQAKILRMLQDQTFERVGGSQTVRTDVRLIAATNRDLEAMSAEGRFRSDLFYRLNGFTIALPPLRQRRDDIPLLIEHFLRRTSRELNRDVRAVSSEAQRLLESFDWPGNVRELESAIRFAVVQAVGDVITPECLPESLRGHRSRSDPSDFPTTEVEICKLTHQLLEAGTPDLYRQIIHAADRAILELVLKRVRGNQVQASELLGISRTTLRAKMQSLGMLVEKQLSVESE